MRSRATVAIVGALALVAIVLLVRGLRSDEKTPTPPAPTATATPSPRVHSSTPALESRPPPADPGEKPTPVAIDPSKAPALDAPVSKPAPPQVPFDRDETIAKREADLKLLDETSVRLEAELAAARSANDSTAIQELEIRITRLASLKKQRTVELTTIRSGGPLPP